MLGGIKLKHAKALIIKFIVSFVILYMVLAVLYDLSFGIAFLTTIVVGVTSYLLGDLLILPRSNNFVATIADIGLAFFFVYYIGSVLTYDSNLFFPSLISAIGIGLFEFFFHKYVYDHVIHNENISSDVSTSNLRFQTEASEELTPDFKDQKHYKKKKHKHKNKK